MKICIVDDSAVVRSLVKKALELNNYKDVLEAEDGVDAIDKIKTHKNDIGLYVLDVNMPRMNGLDLIKEIRMVDSSTPIVMLTTETDMSKMEEAKNNGATGWIVKPFETEKFLKVVSMFLN